MGRKYKDFELKQFDDGNAFAEVAVFFRIVVAYYNMTRPGFYLL